MKQIFSISIFLALAVIVLWSVTTNYSSEEADAEVKYKNYAEVFMNQFEMTSMNKNGNPDYIINGSYLQRYSSSNNTEIDQPVFQLLQEHRQWLISADKAIINDESETINFLDNVVMKQHDTALPVTIHTDRLLINTKTQMARTRARVDITRGNSRLKSKGMIFNNITSELELSSSVDGHYIPYD
jgi:LPS export ABC transporter protein LptC